LRSIAAVITLVLLSIPAQAKPFYKNWKWWIGEAAIGGAISLDVYSTARVVEVCPGCGETSILYAEHPSSAGLVRGGLIDLGIETVFHAGVYHFGGEFADEPESTMKYIQWPAVSWILHGGYAARHNYKIVDECSRAGIVC
jgi:hypothetical protein